MGEKSCELSNISFHTGSSNDKEEIINFLNDHFLPFEPMNIAIQLISPGYRIPFFDKMVETHLAMEDTLVVLAREDMKLMGLAVFVMEKT